MKTRLRKPLAPYVTTEQILDYDANREETSTGSRLIDAVLEAFQVPRLLAARDVAQYLGTNATKLSGAVEIICGRPYSEVRDCWVRHHMALLQEEHPEWSNDELAHAMGYHDRSTLWNVMHRKARKDYYKDTKRAIEMYRMRELADKLRNGQ